jgi:hypothetical protein
MNTQEVRAGVIDLVTESARNARRRGGHDRSEDRDSDGIDVELDRPSKRRCEVMLDAK